MSKLDYITIAIVAVCILAIIFLVYKMTDLFQNDQGEDKIENVQDTVETEDDDVYDYEIDGEVDTTQTGNAGTDAAPATQPATTPTEQGELNAETSPAEDDEREPSTDADHFANPGGKFMVFGGTFEQKSHADAQVRSLKKMGYQNAKIEIFDRGKYAVVLVDRFDNMADAERLVKKLKADDVNCYIKMKER